MVETKPTLIAFIGKSASGKTTLANYFSYKLEKYNLWISDTTRPQRVGEQEGHDYYFITEQDFLNKLADNQYLEGTCFRGWYYGHSKDSLTLRNIGIFDVKGIKNILKNHVNEFEHITIYYVQAGTIQRLKRSYKREGKWKIEYFRRLIADFIDFLGLKHWIKKHLTSNITFAIIKTG